MGLFGSSAERQERRAERKARKEAFRLEKMGIRSARQTQRQENLGKVLPSLLPVVGDLFGGGAKAGAVDIEGGVVPPPPNPMKAALPLILGLVVVGTLLKKKKGGF